MWSAWFERVDVYLGQGLAMLKLKGQPPQVWRYPSTSPLTDVLLNLSAVLAEQMPKQRQLVITLSGALCPASGFTVPSEVQQWQEQHAIALAHVCQNLQLSADQLHCEIDGLHPHIAASVSTAVFDELQRWAESVHCPITAINPSWVLATQCALARRPAIRSVLLHEPDNVTLLLEQTTGLTLLEAMDAPTLATIAQDWCNEQGLAPAQLLQMKLRAETQAAPTHGPRVWADHWQVIA